MSNQLSQPVCLFIGDESCVKQSFIIDLLLVVQYKGSDYSAIARLLVNSSIDALATCAGIDRFDKACPLVNWIIRRTCLRLN